MPNWVHNRIAASGSQDALDALEKKMVSEDNVFNFASLIPIPDEVTDHYNWQVANWGTKWDACHSYVERDADGEVIFRFDTAWSPPIPVIDALVTQHPDLNFEYHYEEEQGWGGNITFTKGVAGEHHTYDIPNSHAEMDERRGGCWCTPEEAVFDDCFAEQAKALPELRPETLEAAKALSAGWGGNLEELIAVSSRL